MDNLYKKIEELCNQSNISLNRMCKESGAAQGSVSDLKSGRTKTLSAQNLSKIAAYFNITVDDLLGTKKPPADQELADFLQEVHDRSDRAVLFKRSKYATPEQLKAILALLPKEEEE